MLHTVNKSPNEKSSLESCLRVANTGSDILLIEDAVYACIDKSEISSQITKALKNFSIYVLQPDMECRGISESMIIPGVQIIDYDGFVSLAVSNDCVQSWL